MTEINHQRIQNWYDIEEETWTNIEDLGNGIWCYKDVIPDGKEIIETVSNVLDGSSSFLKWMPAYVGYQQLMPEYRNCHDFKYKHGIMPSTSKQIQTLEKTYSYLYYRQLQAVKKYCKTYNIGELRYWEAMNLVKYGPGEHFQEHHDHGYSYNCTVSLVLYLNDDYQGGEINFRLQNLMIKPEAGDLFVFPSNFMYPHRAMPVISGTKYSLVTMLDYSDKFHKPEIYQETGS
jgi:hypothetical protein